MHTVNIRKILNKSVSNPIFEIIGHEASQEFMELRAIELIREAALCRLHGDVVGYDSRLTTATYLLALVRVGPTKPKRATRAKN